MYCPLQSQNTSRKATPLSEQSPLLCIKGEQLNSIFSQDNCLKYANALLTCLLKNSFPTLPYFDANHYPGHQPIPLIPRQAMHQNRVGLPRSYK